MQIKPVTEPAVKPKKASTVAPAGWRTTGLKTCATCKAEKPIEDFHWTPQRGDKVPSSYCKLCWNDRCRGKTYDPQYYQDNKEAYKERALNSYRQRTYRLSPEQFQAKLEAQENRCVICNDEFTKTPHVDHNHTTNEVRDLLCHNCNLGLGFFRDNPEFLDAAKSYLKKWD